MARKKKQYIWKDGPAVKRDVWLLYGIPYFNERLSTTIPAGYHWRIMLECGHISLAPSRHRFSEIGPDGRYIMGGLSDYITSANTRPDTPVLDFDSVNCGRCRTRIQVEYIPPPPPRHVHYRCPECKRCTSCEKHTEECLEPLRDRVRDSAIEYDYDETSVTDVFDKMVNMLAREQLEELVGG